MAVLSLHSIESETPGPEDTHHLGNFIDLVTEEVVMIHKSKYDTGVARLKARLDELPDGVKSDAILVTDVNALPDFDNYSDSLGVSIAKIGPKEFHQDLNDAQFDAERLAFDKMTYEDVYAHENADSPDGRKPVNKLDFEPRQLTEKDLSLGIGTRFVLRIADSHAIDGYRYFRFLVHAAGADGNTAPMIERKKIVLQFEELQPHRIIVPLGIRETGAGFDIVTPETIPAHFVNEDTTELMWSIRPSQRDYSGSALYDRPFPVAKVVFRQRQKTDVSGELVWRHFESHPPAWVGGVRQRNLTSRSYMNTTYSVVINHAQRLSVENTDAVHRVKVDPYKWLQPGDIGYVAGADTPRRISTTRYMYALHLIDGSVLEIRTYDPPVDVEDQM